MSVWRHSGKDGWLVAASVAQGLATVCVFALLAPRGLSGMLLAAVCFGFGVCWCSNTVSHNHLHAPLFRARSLNRALALYLTLLTAVPQSIWRARHLWHHAGEPRRRARPLPQGARLELALIAALWSALLLAAPEIALLAYAPGYALGMALCALQGRMEHAQGRDAHRGVSHYGALYNFFWFNDGYHAEHHRFPGEHWSRLPERRGELATVTSRHCALFRIAERLAARGDELCGAVLCALERCALASPVIQRFLLRTHERAFRIALEALPRAPKTAVVIGGGLFPRTVLVLGKLFPALQIVVVDRSEASCRRARAFLRGQGLDESRVRFEQARFDPQRHAGCDLVVAPLGFVGNRDVLAAAARRTALLRHDWLWRRGVIVSWLLLKRVALSNPEAARESARLTAADELCAAP